MDGVAVLAQLARNAGRRQLFRAAAHGLRDALRALTRRRPHLVPMVGEPGSRAIIAKHGAEQDYTRDRGPELAQRSVRAHRARGGVQPADQVRLACLLPTAGAGRHCRQHHPAGRRPPSGRRTPVRGELREYPIDHVDAYTGPAQQRALADQLDFLRRHLAPAASHRAAITTTDWSHQ